MARRHDDITQSQFGPRATAYVESAVHACGPDLEALDQIAAYTRPGRTLDLGCGGGHVSYCLAPNAGEVVACDVSCDMLAVVSSTAMERGFTNIQTCKAPAESLPFRNGAFDLVASRFSAHHWRDFKAGIAEAHRVARPGATAVFVDVVASGRPLLDTHLQAVELLRDTSHVRDYTAAEWIATLAQAGFTVQTMRRHRLRMHFQTWIERMRTPEPLVAAIRTLQSAASQEVRDHFAIEPDGSFMLDVVTIHALA